MLKNIYANNAMVYGGLFKRRLIDGEKVRQEVQPEEADATTNLIRASVFGSFA